MRDYYNNNAFTFYELKWDSEYFGVTSAKAILNRSLSSDEWHNLKERFRDYNFISIENRNSDPVNTQMIGKETSAYLVDVNIQFLKTLDREIEQPKSVTIHQALKRDEIIVEMADFQFSKFTEDPELAKRGGDKVYHQWLINSFNQPDKFFALSRDEHDSVNGFLLHSYSNEKCVIELIAVSKTAKQSGIGTSLFNMLENSVLLNGFNTIKVGTQERNLGAINFYNKMGCKQIGCHQVYHLWNI
jgi:dTDP-4-amino-4,6-dideoxy-D-galactose acyltransferase